MKNLLLIFPLLLVGCSMPQEEKENIAAVTCSIMSETRNMDAAVRVRELNEARDKIGGEPFLRGDAAIKEAFDWELCQELVLNEDYDERLQSLKDAKRELERIAEEKRAEEQRIAEEKRAEEQRIAEEKRAEEQRIAEEEKIEAARIAEEEAARIAEVRRIAECKRNLDKGSIDRMIDRMEPINSITPVYPERAKQRGITGYVDLVFNISDTGSVFNIVPKGYCADLGIPCKFFNDSAVDAASKFIFDPLVINCLPAVAESKTHRFIFDITEAQQYLYELEERFDEKALEQRYGKIFN